MERGDIPPQYVDQWDRLTADLDDATIELVKANQRHYTALMARLALHQTIRHHLIESSRGA